MPQMPGLLGLALSGAGPSAIALATAGFDEIGKAIAAHFERAGPAATIRFLEVAQEGVSSLENRRGGGSSIVRCQNVNARRI